MRAFLVNTQMTVPPGQAFSFDIEVSNTAEVIDAVRVGVAGLPGAVVTAAPPELFLFPGTSGKVAVSVELPKGFRAGRYEANAEAVSRLLPDQAATCDFVVDVEPFTAASLSVTPATRTGHRKSRFSLSAANLGNTDLEVSLEASDPERALRLECLPARVSVSPASSAAVTLVVRGRRQLFGGDRARQVNITGVARPRSAPGAGIAAAQGSGGASGASPGAARGAAAGAAALPVDLDARATYVQRPRIPRGVVTALVLASIVALWAGIFTVGLKAVLAQRAATKSAPLSFFAPLSSPKSPRLAAATSATPAGFVPKDLAPLGIGGTITGQVISPYEPGGVGAVTVEAFLIGGKRGDVTSAGTASNGTYQIVGLFPGSYKIAFTDPGFATMWYPGTTSQSSATAVPVPAETTVTNINGDIAGKPGSITGQVLTGETPSPPVLVTPLVDNVPTGSAVTADSSGLYALKGLASPATYTLAFTAPGFEQSDLQVFVDGGQAVVANTVELQSGLGEIDGTVTDGSNPLGGVSVVASANGNTFTSATASAGSIGRFSLRMLPTPATYLLTFSDQGFGTQSVAVDLGPGQVINDLSVAMVGGTGTISGLVTGPGGARLGGVSVSVGGIANPASTETLTGGSNGAQVGAYAISGLPTPGTYAVTFSLPGYTSQTLGVTLGSNGLAANVDATLTPTTGLIQGTVRNATTAAGLPGVTVSITDGVNPTQTVTASLPSGGYKLTALPADTYTVTFSLTGYQSQTALIALGPGQTVSEDIALLPLGASPTTSTTGAAPGGPQDTAPVLREASGAMARAGSLAARSATTLGMVARGAGHDHPSRGRQPASVGP
jgi:hypothetical protein